MNINRLFASAEQYPVTLNFESNVMGFVRMSPATYREATFLGPRIVERAGTDFTQVRLDDILFAARSVQPSKKSVNYILHTAYCSSTLLARYFELLPSCFVLKEPQLLTDVAMTSEAANPRWQDIFDIAVRLLSRTFEPNQTTIIKTNVPCNALAAKLLEANESSSLTFLMTPIREFILAVMKLEGRRLRVRFWNRDVYRSGRVYPQLAGVNPGCLRDSESAAYWWLATHFLGREMSMGPYRSRVTIIDGRRLAISPEDVLGAAMNVCGIQLGSQAISALTKHPDMMRHSKDSTRFYDSSDRSRDIREQEKHFGLEVDLALEWVASHGLNLDDVSI